ncbi:MAG: WD40/YVTN/BNR-like repeat-containing protein, partial [Planctomycetota bacterium]
MLAIARPAALLAASLALSCAAGFPRECVSPASPRAPVSDADGLILRFDEIASLPGGTVLLAGYLHDGANTVRSALHVSRDGGLTWRDSGLRFPGSAIMDLRTFGTSNVWGLVTFRQEGCSDPTHVLRSVDAGATWSVTPLPCEGGGVTWASRFEFDDALHGLLSVADSLGRVRTFRTDDGGASWRRM